MARRHNTAHAPSNGARNVLEVRGDIAPPAPPDESLSPEEQAHALGWIKGQLLNVRNAGATYNVTLEGTEYDTRRPNGLQFAHVNDCQNFISRWYAPEAGGRPPWG